MKNKIKFYIKKTTLPHKEWWPFENKKKAHEALIDIRDDFPDTKVFSK